MNENAREIDAFSTRDILKTINNEDKKVPFAIENELASIEQVVEMVTETFKNSGRLFYIGAGTSGRLGVLDASECPPTFNTDPEMIQGIISGEWS